jgi:hypothetical protein
MYLYGVTGDRIPNFAQCSLPQNVVNEKVYALAVPLLLVLLLIAFIQLAVGVTLLLSPSLRRHLLQCSLKPDGKVRTHFEKTITLNILIHCIFSGCPANHFGKEGEIET